MSGVSAILGADETRNKTSMQVDGTTAMRIDTARLREAMWQSRSLMELLLRYVQTVLMQVSHSAVSNAHHRMEARLARWLLMCHDRVDGNEIALTHRFMSMMLPHSDRASRLRCISWRAAARSGRRAAW